MNEGMISPISINERIKSIDIIRGLAIFGIFLVNMPSFNSPMLYLQSGTLWDSPLDRGTEVFIDVFAQASFYTLFSFLFGFGMVLFHERVVAKHYRFAPLVTRRLIFLLLLGSVHAFLIWHGDILISYAIVGAIFLLFHKIKTKSLLVLALLMIFVPSIMLFVLLLLVVMAEPDVGHTLFSNQVYQSIDIYSSGTFSEITIQRIQDWYYVNNLDSGLLLVFALLPMFLLGAFIAKSKWFHHINQHEKKVKRLWLVSLLIGLPIKLLPYYTDKNIATEYLQDSVGGPSTAIFYATSIILLTRRDYWLKILSPLAAVGRLSLSNYLFQSLLTTMIFYNYGLGLYGKVSPFYGVFLTIGIFIVQIILSKIWLRYFSFGPVEWFWRTATYGKKQPMKLRG